MGARRRSLRAVAAVLGGILLLGACRANVDGARVEIQASVLPDSGCTFNTGNQLGGPASFDPQVPGAEAGFLLALLLRNNLETRGEDTLLLDNAVNLRNRVHDLSVVGFEGCWAQYGGDLGTPRQGAVLDCDQLSGSRATLPASGEVPEGSAQSSIILVRVLTQAHLKQLFGASFDAPALPPRGSYSQPDVDGNPQGYYGIAPAAPGSDAGRPAAWGDKYPATLRAPVVVQLRAVLATQTGETVHSSWFVMPITICPGCALAACGDLVQRRCPLPCADGSACNSGVCTIGGATSPCAYGPRMTGYVNDVQAPAACLPAQMQSLPLCLTQPRGCPTTFAS